MRDGLAMSEFLLGVGKKVSAFVGIITFAYNTLSFANASLDANAASS